MNESDQIKCNDCKVQKEGPTLIFACSGAADVGGVADQAARKLSAEGVGKMFCLAAIGGGINSYLESTDKAGRILAIDGCSVECAKHTLEEAGFMDFDHVKLADLGLIKGKTGIQSQAINTVFEAAKGVLA